MFITAWERECTVSMSGACVTCYVGEIFTWSRTGILKYTGVCGGGGDEG